MSSNIKLQRICQHCGSEFTARTTVTRYCGDDCAKRAYKARQKAAKIETSNKQVQAVKRKPVLDLKAKEYLTIRDTASLLNCSRQTVYNLVQQGTLKAVNLSARKTLVKRSDIDQLFEQQATPHPLTLPDLHTDDCYTLSEVRALYTISEKTLHTLIKRHAIPKLKQGIYAYVPKKIIDQLLKPEV